MAAPDCRRRSPMTDEPIPQADPRAGFLALRTRIDIAITQVIESGTYILGSEVSGFEQEFSAFVGVRHGIGVASGTDAIILALKGIGVGPDDYVVTVPHTAVSPAAPIHLVGAQPRPCVYHSPPHHNDPH